MAPHRVQLNPDSQIDLRLRKRLATSLLVARCCDRFAQSEETPIDDEIAQIYAKEVANRFFTQLDCDEIEDDTATVSLIDLLNGVELDWPREDNNQITTLRSRFLEGIKHFDCRRCGDDENKACNNANDDILFGEENGGRCLSFLTELIENASKIAIDQYTRYTGDLFNSDFLPGLRIETTPWPEGLSSTLDIDGELVPPSDTSTDAILRVRWPNEGPDLQEALLCLPYLIFHETFVHWPQGTGSGLNFFVDTGCSFTEGAIDAVACDTLIDLLDNPAHNLLPDSLRLLRESFLLSARKYHDERTNWAPPGDKKEMTKASNKIGQARSYGRTTIYRSIKDIYFRNFRDDAIKSTHQILLALNLQLSKDQRTDFHRYMRGIKAANLPRACPPFPPYPLDKDILPAFDSYLDGFDHFELLSMLKRLSGAG